MIYKASFKKYILKNILIFSKRKFIQLKNILKLAINEWTFCIYAVRM